jgi:hypothetical protein
MLIEMVAQLLLAPVVVGEDHYCYVLQPLRDSLLDDGQIVLRLASMVSGVAWNLGEGLWLVGCLVWCGWRLVSLI